MPMDDAINDDVNKAIYQFFKSSGKILSWQSSSKGLQSSQQQGQPESVQSHALCQSKSYQLIQQGQKTQIKTKVTKSTTK